MISLQKALESQPDFVEADLVLTKDREFIVLHDKTLDATTDVAKVYPTRKRNDGSFYAVDFSLKELSLLKFSQRTHKKRYQSVLKNKTVDKRLTQGVLTFDDFVSTVVKFNKENGSAVGISPELKYPELYVEEGFRDYVLLFAEKLNLLKLNHSKLQILAQCFHNQTVKKLSYMLRKDIELMQLFGENSWRLSSTNYDQLRQPPEIQKLSNYVGSIGVWLGFLFDDKGVETGWFRSLGKNLDQFKVYVYTIRNDRLPGWVAGEKELLAKLSRIGVDGIFTDSCQETKSSLDDLK